MMQLANAFLEPSQRTKHHVSALVETHEQEHKESRDERQRDADGGLDAHGHQSAATMHWLMHCR